MLIFGTQRAPARAAASSVLRLSRAGGRPRARTAGWRLGTALVSGVVLVGGTALVRGQSQPPFGFSRQHADALRAIEQRVQDAIRPEQARREHRILTEEPHLAGSARDRELAQHVADQWRADGLEDVAIVEHPVYLPWPVRYEARLLEPVDEALSLKEDGVAQDKDSFAGDVGIPYCAYSANVDVAAQVVYVNSGNPEDYDLLAREGIEVRGKIAVARYSMPYSYRGFKALTAERRGAAALLLYSDPADDGARKGEVYPWGPWGPDSHLQRGAIVYDFNLPGDPRTPGWASLAGARTRPAADAPSMPHVAAAPLSANDARRLLERLGGPPAPASWQGGLSFTYRLGPGPAKLHLVIENDTQVRPIWNVVGRLRGRERPDEWVVLGNHRDAWVYGGVDPSSGTASLMEVARALGALAREGWRPRRTIVLGNWDAEEFTLTGSTEWGEMEAAPLKAGAVAYLNVDSSASGTRFRASAVPALAQFLRETARDVPDPSGGTIYESWRRAGSDNAPPEGRPGAPPPVTTRLGSGSDYTVFLNFLGVPVADLTFDGPYGVYHSIYDSFTWMDRIGDPGYYYHAAMARYWATAGIRLAEADLLPLDYAAYATELATYLDEAERAAARTHLAVNLAPARDAASRWQAAAALALDRGRQAIEAQDGRMLTAVNGALIAVERALLDDAGLPGRSWYKHLVYAPRPTYEAEVLPALSEAIDAGDATRAAAEVARLARACTRAAGVLDAAR